MGFDINEYFETYGHDLERSERAQIGASVRRLEEWFKHWGLVLLDCYDSIAADSAALVPADPDIPRLAGQTALYEMLSGAIQGQQWDRVLVFGTGDTVPRRSYRPFQQLFQIFLEVRDTPCTLDQALQAVSQRRPPFAQAARLDDSTPGLFWDRLLQVLPPCPEEGPWPSVLEDLLYQLGQCRALFYGRESHRAEALRTRLEQFWLERDAQAAKAAPPPPSPVSPEDFVRRWRFDYRPWAVRELLAEAFPEVGAAYPGDDLLAVTAGEILGETYQRDPALAIRMWRLVLDTAQARLSDPQAAKEMIWDLMDLTWVDSYVDPLLPVPILDALEADEGFARQILQSAYVGKAHEILLEACAAAGRQDQARRLEALLEASPYRAAAAQAT